MNNGDAEKQTKCFFKEHGLCGSGCSNAPLIKSQSKESLNAVGQVGLDNGWSVQEIRQMVNIEIVTLLLWWVTLGKLSRHNCDK